MMCMRFLNGKSSDEGVLCLKTSHVSHGTASGIGPTPAPLMGLGLYSKPRVLRMVARAAYHYAHEQVGEKAVK